MESFPNTKISLEKQPYFHLQMRSNSEYWSIGSKKKMNKLNHALNGNRRNLGYKYLAWNCDKGFVAEKKLDELKVYMHKSKPLIAGVSEVNLVRNENNKNVNSKIEFSTEQLQERLKIYEYEIILPDSWMKHGKARVIVYVKNDINVKKVNLKDDESHLHSILLEVGFGRVKKHFFNFFYREWTPVLLYLK